MALSTNLVIIGGCFLFFLASLDSSFALQNSSFARQGICAIEVPTKDLLSPQHQGPTPQGNGTRPGYSKIEICCSGYERKPHHHYECQPVCDNGCQNGNCTAPNVCTCKKGFAKIDNVCAPSCPVGCLNGVCTNTGSCNCDYGYTLAPDGRYCIPYCTGGCGNGGKCIAPETCACPSGFTVNPQTKKCEYDCQGGCGNGTCVGPNKCSCAPGFIVNIGGIACVPHCPRGCKDGECTGPNICTCKSGYSIDTQTHSICTPHCSSPCLNGICSAPEVCTCRNGYVEKPGSNGHTCVAFCEGGCVNGDCAAPNFCICRAGFAKEDKLSNVCVRKLRKRSLHLELIPEQVLEGY